MTGRKKNIIDSFNDNFKKSVTEMLLLQLLSEQEYYIGDLLETISSRSNRRLNLIFPYAAIYRLVDDHYIIESKKKIAPDGRRRQYYQITETGRAYFRVLKNAYIDSICAVNSIIEKEKQHECRETVSEETKEGTAVSSRNKTTDRQNEGLAVGLFGRA